MKKYKYLLIDLDGTIIDSFEGVSRSFMYALKYYGIEVTDVKTLRPVIGPPLVESFQNLFGFDKEKALEAVEKYRERYTTVGVKEHSLYDGVEDMLAKLKEAGYFISLATSKPEKFARVILKDLELDKYFDFITGATTDGRITTKEDVIENIIKTLNIENKSEMLMIGDRKYDLVGAQYFGIDGAGVLYGYGSEEELKKYNPVLLAKTPEDVVKFLV